MEIIIFVLFMPLFWFGFGWLMPISGLIHLRDKMLGHDPHCGNEGSLIEWGFLQIIASMISIGFFAWLYFQCSLLVFGFGVYGVQLMF